MAHYTSTNIGELEAYNEEVNQGEGYDGVYTTNWAEVISHPNGVDFAIVAHPDYPSDLESLEVLTADWFNIEE